MNGKYIPIGVRLPANVIIDVLQPPEIDVGEYEICASIKVISTGPKKRCLKVAQSLTLGVETTAPGRVDFGVWIQNSKTKVAASNRDEISLFAMNYSSGHESSINQTSLYHMCLKSGSDKCAHHRYDRFYWKYLPVAKRNGDIRIGEVGLSNGASIRFWKSLYPNASIVVLEIAQTKLTDLVFT